MDRLDQCRTVRAVNSGDVRGPSRRIGLLQSGRLGSRDHRQLSTVDLVPCRRGPPDSPESIDELTPGFCQTRGPATPNRRWTMKKAGTMAGAMTSLLRGPSLICPQKRLGSGSGDRCTPQLIASPRVLAHIGSYGANRDRILCQNCVTCPPKPRSNTVVYGYTSTHIDVA